MARQMETTESVSMAFMLVLEALSPVERAVFLLREMFEYSYDEIAEIVEKSAENCRQIFARAKGHIDAGKPRFEASPEKRDEIARQFFAACERGELEGLVRVLGADHVARLLAGIFARFASTGIRVVPVEVNGQPGAKFVDRDDRVVGVLSLDTAFGRVHCVRSVVNPEKLRHLGPVSDLLTRPLRCRRPAP
jgi:RNA polymerase sigma-70 factor (ECF subfamily)